MSWKYTRGPWTASQLGCGGGAIWAGPRYVCDVDNSADAKLIAAAPEMFELLESLENDTGVIPDGIWNSIQEVCKKVRGE